MIGWGRWMGHTQEGSPPILKKVGSLSHPTIPLSSYLFIYITRSYAALRAADLDWIVGPGYSSGRYILGKNHEKPTWNREKPTWNHGSQLAFEMREGGRAGITEKRYSRRVTTDL